MHSVNGTPSSLVNGTTHIDPVPSTPPVSIDVPKTLDSLQILRAWAAFMVVAVHLGMDTEQRYGTWILPKFTQAGIIGVDVFFCLSGFIMYYTSWRRFGVANAVRQFFYRRLVRIYPIYWIATLLLMALACWPESHLSTGSLSMRRVITSFLLLPQSGNPILVQGWTLVHEVRFYAIFGVMLLLSRRAGLGAMAVWAMLSFAVLLTSYFNQPLLDSGLPARAITYLCHPSSIQFVLGVGSAWIICHQRTPKWLDACLLPVAVVLIAIVVQWFPELAPKTKYYAITLFTIPSILLILGAALAERRWRPKLPGLGIALGNASYSVYLIHTMILGPMVWNLFPSSESTSLRLIWAGICVVVIHLLCWLFHIFVENPIHTRTLRATPTVSMSPAN
ncbi:acyltransferase family protein [bacterium]|nr:acyltransferase family protein [bacterium]